MTLSIVTASKNRTAHLIETAGKVSQSRLHAEHIIIDWSSDPPIQRNLLPADERIKIYRVDGEEKWWLTRAYNLGFSLAQEPCILKLDADCWVTENFMRDNLEAMKGSDLLCSRLTLQDWNLDHALFKSTGQFFVTKEALHKVRGFNPYLKYWGWDDIDLYGRIFLAGFKVQRLAGEGLHEIEHGAYSRMPQAMGFFNKSNVFRNGLLSAANNLNKSIAKQCIERKIEWAGLPDCKSVHEVGGVSWKNTRSLDEIFDEMELNAAVREMMGAGHGDNENYPVRLIFKLLSAALPMGVIKKIYEEILDR